ncbi:MAG: DUF3291 domain-containing protein [Flavobacteriaceae bacterium]
MHHLAQVNIARMLGPIDSPVMAEFVYNLDRINTVADSSEGFVWRLKDEDNNATSLQIFEDEYLIVNMSVWTSLEALFQFTYNSAHTEIFKRKKEWFSKMKEMHMACWYIPEGELPTTEEAKKRLAYLNKHGETPYAFTFKSKFSAAEAAIFMPIDN